MTRIALLAAIASILCASVAFAQNEKPLTDISRFAFGLGFQQTFYGAATSTADPAAGEFEGGVVAAWQLFPHLSLASSSFYGFTSETVRTTVGVRLALYQGGQ